MFWTKKRRIFASAIAITLASVALLKDFQKEQRQIQKDEEVISKIEKVESKSSRLKSNSDDYGRTDAGYDVSQEIKSLLELAKRLEKLDDLISKGKYSSKEAIDLTEIRSVEKARKDMIGMINHCSEYVSNQEASFYEALKGNNLSELKNIREHVTERIEYFENLKKGLEKAVLELEEAQREIIKIKANLANFPSKEAQNKLEELEEELIKKLQIYDILIEGFNTQGDMWKETSKNLDLIESKNK